MITLKRSRDAWGTPKFGKILKLEIERLPADLLPLQGGIIHGSHLVGKPLQTIILGSSENETSVLVNMGIFFCSVTAGCSCADDPTPADENNEYCEISLEINKVTAKTTATPSSR